MQQIPMVLEHDPKKSVAAFRIAETESHHIELGRRNQSGAGAAKGRSIRDRSIAVST